jgi:uncharacterized membrane protein
LLACKIDGYVEKAVRFAIGFLYTGTIVIAFHVAEPAPPVTEQKYKTPPY